MDGGGHGGRGVVERDIGDDLAGETLRGALQLPEVDLRAGQLVQGHVQGVGKEPNIVDRLGPVVAEVEAA